MNNSEGYIQWYLIDLHSQNNTALYSVLWRHSPVCGALDYKLKDTVASIEYAF